MYHSAPPTEPLRSASLGSLVHQTLFFGTSEGALKAHPRKLEREETTPVYVILRQDLGKKKRIPRSPPVSRYQMDATIQ